MSNDVIHRVGSDTDSRAVLVWCPVTRGDAGYHYYDTTEPCAGCGRLLTVIERIEIIEESLDITKAMEG